MELAPNDDPDQLNLFDPRAFVIEVIHIREIVTYYDEISNILYEVMPNGSLQDPRDIARDGEW